jgi:ribonucleoside-diphosphate reductase alpha chain
MIAKIEKFTLPFTVDNFNNFFHSIIMDLLTNRFSSFGIAMLHDRYLMPNETLSDLFKRVSNAYADNLEHAERIYDYILKCWFMPATPILSNGGTNRGMPISCFLNECEDSLESIDDLWHENTYLAAKGGGIGSYWGNVRSIGEPITGNGSTSGIIPFIKVMDSLTLAISQGSLRRGNAAVYLPVSHPEIEEFIDIRRPTGGDPNRRSLNIHHAVVISDDFMNAVEQNLSWDLVSPKSKKKISSIKARDLWVKILTSRVETGEPYILFIDNVRKYAPKSYKELGLEQKTSNLCSEITLTTGIDHLGKDRTAVCCLSSLNVEYFEEWHDHPLFIEDVLRFLDNVIDSFIKNAPNAMSKATYSANRERSIGLGIMGFHSYLQKNMIPFESSVSKSFNKKLFSLIKEKSDLVSRKLAIEKGPCPDSFDVCIKELIKENKISLSGDYTIKDNATIFSEYISYIKGDQQTLSFDINQALESKVSEIGERFTHKIAIAPTASISEICGGCSPGIEPFIANTFNKKNLTGTGSVRNKYLKELLISKDCDTEDVWQSIIANEGSVQELDCLTSHEKSVFKTAFEIDQAYLIELSADRTPYICQAQSLNIFLPSIISRAILHKIHYLGWKMGIKSFYYLRSRSVGRGENITQMNQNYQKNLQKSLEKIEMDECLSCQ